MSIQEAYLHKMQALLKEWSAQLNLLEAKLDSAGADMKVRRAEELDALRSKHLVATEKIRELETTGGEVWDQVKETADKVWEDLKIGVAEAQAKLK
jgi:hypothetical protein